MKSITSTSKRRKVMYQQMEKKHFTKSNNHSKFKISANQSRKDRPQIDKEHLKTPMANIMVRNYMLSP